MSIVTSSLSYDKTHVCGTAAGTLSSIDELELELSVLFSRLSGLSSPSSPENFRFNDARLIDRTFENVLSAC